MNEFRLAQDEQIEWEEVGFVRGKKEIEKENQEWIKGHFANFPKKNNIMQTAGPKMRISIRETMVAIDKMGKNKAAAADELLDVIF